MFKAQLIPSRPHRGFTALELIIVLVIGFSIIGLAAGKMRDMMDSSKAVRALDSILMLTANIQSLSRPTGYGNTGNDLVEPLKDADLIPKSLKIITTPAQVGQAGTTSLLNQWNAAVAVIVDATDNQTFNIKYSGVTKPACNKLLKDLLTNYKVVILSNENDTNGTTIPQNASVTDIVAGCNRNQGNAVVLHLTPL